MPKQAKGTNKMANRKKYDTYEKAMVNMLVSEKVNYTGSHTYRQTYIHIYRQPYRQTYIHADRHSLPSMGLSQWKRFKNTSRRAI